jgi:M6 family metalloprotease-like protein
MGAPSKVLTSSCFAAVSILLTVLIWSGVSHAVPLRPDILEKLKNERLPVPSGTQLATLGVDVPVEKLSRRLLRRHLTGPAGERAQLRALVLLVEFSDLPAEKMTHDDRYYERLLFGEGGIEKSQRDYYLENSYGKLDVVGDVYGWYKLPNTYLYYAGGSYGLCSACYPRNARGLVEDAVRLANSDVDFSLYDNDGPDGIPSSGDDDGYVDALFIVHSGPGYEETGIPDYIISHEWMLAVPFYVDGVRVYVYSMEAEDSKLGAFCHEFAHILGLPDLYDRNYDSYGLDLWSLMGSGLWLDGGNSPSHLDAWSKARLGFVEPEVVEDNKPGVTLPPVETSPVVYKLWKNGIAGKEYFLLENRENIGFDSPLPGSGLLIYHVDETVHNNDNQLRYMVALDQADGNFDLERRQFAKQFGADAGDPFPGWSHNTSFTAFTTPNSLSNDRQDVEVRVTNISLEGNLVRLDATVETGPEPIITRLFTDDTGTGNGDGIPDAGETAKLYCEVKNIGLASGSLTAVASCANIYVRLLSDRVKYDFLAQDETRLPKEGFVFQVDSSLARDPYRVYFVIDITDGAFFDRTKSVVVGVGDSLGIRDDFESGQGEWTHGGTQGIDDWHLSSRRAFSAASSWHCGREDTSSYGDYQDSYLETPFFISGAGSRLTFYQWLDVENENSRLAWDGCLVEASTDNMTWEPVEPVGGYPYTIGITADTEGAGRGCFSGRSKEWEGVECDLSKYSGALWIRFRLISDGSVSGEGWYVDDVRVSTLKTPYTIAFENVKPSPGKVQVSWRVDPHLSLYTGQGMALFRLFGSIPPGGDAWVAGAEGSLGTTGQNTQLPATLGVNTIYELIYTDTSRSIGLHSFVDTMVVSGNYYHYFIRDVSAQGGVNYIEGPRVYVPHAIHSVSLSSCWPNPYVPKRGKLGVAFEIPDGPEGPIFKKTRVAVFDVTGRMIAVLLDDRALSGSHFISWDGTDSDGNAVAGGVYIISLDTGDAHFSRKSVVLR